MTYYIGTAGFESTDELQHHGITGMKWGVRRYQNYDGTLTTAGRERYRKFNRAVVAVQAERDFGKKRTDTMYDYNRVKQEKEAAIDAWMPDKGQVEKNQFASKLSIYSDMDRDSKYYEQSKRIINKLAGFDYYKARDHIQKEIEARQKVLELLDQAKNLMG